MSVKEGLKAFNWVTDRVDQVSAWLKKKVRSGKVESIDRAIDNRDVKSINRIVQSIEKTRDKRTNAS
jgi:hypothetical protein